MSNTEIQSKVNELRELRRMADELTAEIESIQDAIKAHMTAIDADTLTGADYKITWKTVTSSRFDSTAFKKAMPELAERFTKPSTSRSRWCPGRCMRMSKIPVNRQCRTAAHCSWRRARRCGYRCFWIDAPQKFLQMENVCL